MSMILLQINATANWGSTGKIAEQIGLRAMAHGWNSYIAYGRMMNPSRSKLIKIGSALDNYIHYAHDRLLDMEGLSSKSATRDLVHKISEIRPDIVQLHNIHDHFLNYQILFEYLSTTNIPVVWTFHDCWAFTGHCYHFIHENCIKWQKECDKCIKRNKLVDRSHENFLLKKRLFGSYNNLTIIPCSKWMDGFVKKSFFKDKRIEVIHNGIDLSTFHPFNDTSEIIESLKPFRIIAVSNVWLPYKGEIDIYKLRELLPQSDFEIIMVGLSTAQIKRLPSGIRGIQRTQNMHELVKLYSTADVLINPTYADTFPTVNLEALACGTPVITYKTGGSPEAIDKKTGVVIEQGNIFGLADAIKNMKAAPLSAKDCRSRAEMYFDKNKCYERYVELYDDLHRQ